MNLSQKGHYQGLFFLMMMMAVSCASDVIVKFMGERLDALEVIFFRFFFGLLTLLPFAALEGKRVFKTKRLGFNVMRGILGAASFFLYTYSVIYLPLVEVVTILWTIPLFVIILSIFFLGEKISTVRWAATLIGFLGLSFITLYNSDASFSLRLLYIAPIASAFLFAVQDVMIKKVVDNESKITMLLYFAMVAGAISFFPALLVWRTPTTREYFMLFLLGANGNLMQYFIFKAFSAADLSALAPFRYVEFLLSAVFAFIFFAEVPGTNVLVGALILIPSTLYLTASEKRRNCCSA